MGMDKNKSEVAEQVIHLNMLTLYNRYTLESLMSEHNKYGTVFLCEDGKIKDWEAISGTGGYYEDQ